MTYRIAGFKVSRHAIERYQERFGPVTFDAALIEIDNLLRTAKPRHVKPVKRKKKTSMIPAGECLFVFSRGVCATVIPLADRMRKPNGELHLARTAAPDHRREPRAPLSYVVAIWAKVSRLFGSVAT